MLPVDKNITSHGFIVVGELVIVGGYIESAKNGEKKINEPETMKPLFFIFHC